MSPQRIMEMGHEIAGIVISCQLDYLGDEELADVFNVIERAIQSRPPDTQKEVAERIAEKIAEAHEVKVKAIARMEAAEGAWIAMVDEALEAGFPDLDSYIKSQAINAETSEEDDISLGPDAGPEPDEVEDDDLDFAELIDRISELSQRVEKLKKVFERKLEALEPIEQPDEKQPGSSPTTSHPADDF